jgi:hypothetical protein
MPVVDKPTMQSFLEEDLYDALRWLFLGAVVWSASRQLPDRFGRLCVLGMLTSFVQARALYEFFYHNGRGDDARVRDFVPSWDEPESHVFRKYMASRTPANKRVFHLVYKRSAHAGGPGHDGPDHLKHQVVEFAKDLRRLTELLVDRVEPDFRNSAQSALRKALQEAELEAKHYGITDPL